MVNNVSSEAEKLFADLSKNELRFADRLIFDDSLFHKAIRPYIPRPCDKASKEVSPTCKPVGSLLTAIESEKLEQEINHHAAKGDKKLSVRWQGMRSFALFLLKGGAKNLKNAISAFEQLHPNQNRLRPNDWEKVANKVFERMDDGGTLDVFKDEQWSAGQFLVYDLLCSIYLPEKAALVEQERTPIFVVHSIHGLRAASVLWLTVERRYGGGGLVLPDWWSLGLITIGEAEEEENFRTAIEKAINAAKPNPDYRHYWRLSIYQENMLKPEEIKGRSAQASAACCVLALNEASENNPRPLLDEKAGLSAELALPLDVKIEKLRLKQVDKESFEQKLDAAAKAGLHGMMFCQGQWPQEKTVHEPEPNSVKGQILEPHRVYLLGVELLVDAYDSLLITSRAVAEYKKKVADKWNELWNPQPTGDEFKNASQPNAE